MQAVVLPCMRCRSAWRMKRWRRCASPPRWPRCALKWSPCQPRPLPLTFVSPATHVLPCTHSHADTETRTLRPAHQSTCDMPASEDSPPCLCCAADVSQAGVRSETRPHAGLTQRVSELECQLAAAQRDVQRLATDNDALMEVSNALAAQQRRACQRREAEAREGKSISVQSES